MQTGTFQCWAIKVIATLLQTEFQGCRMKASIVMDFQMKWIASDLDGGKQCCRNAKCHRLVLRITFPNDIPLYLVRWMVCVSEQLHMCIALICMQAGIFRLLYVCCCRCCRFYLSSFFVSVHWSLSLKDAGMWFVNEKQTQIKQSQQHSTHQHQQRQQHLISLFENVETATGALNEQEKEWMQRFGKKQRRKKWAWNAWYTGEKKPTQDTIVCATIE